MHFLDQGRALRRDADAGVAEGLEPASARAGEADDLEPSTSKFVGVQNVEIRV